MRRTWRSVLVVLAVAAAVTGAAYVRVLLTAREALVKAEVSLADERPDDALFHFRRAAHAYAPLNPWNGRAHDRLWQMGRKAELEGDQDRALRAYRSIRSSILAARSFYTPHTERLEEVDGRIARLMARLPPPPVDRGKTEAQRMREHLELLRDTPQPDPLWSLLLVIGFAAWVGAAVCFIMIGLDRDLGIRRRPALVTAAVFVSGLALWLAGLFLA
jgi:hypothetical protein